MTFSLIHMFDLSVDCRPCSQDYHFADWSSFFQALFACFASSLFGAVGDLRYSLSLLRIV